MENKRSSETECLLNRLTESSIQESENYISYLRSIVFDDVHQYSDDSYVEILNTKNYKRVVRFAAFYCLFTRYRRFDQRDKLIILVEKYLDNFKNDEEVAYLYHVAYSQYYKNKFIELDDAQLYHKAKACAKNALKLYWAGKFKDIGCFNNYVDIVLSGTRVEGLVTRNDISVCFKYLDNAIDIRRERNLEPYANYYCSKARLYAWTKDYKNAKEMMEKAISCERTDRRDSFIRIANYHNIQLEIQTDESIELLESKMSDVMGEYNEVKKRIERQQTRYIEMLSFFSAVIALIMSSITITLGANSFSEASALILILSGGLIMGYSILKYLFSEELSPRKFGICLLLSFCMIVIGYLIGIKAPLIK